MLVFVLHLVYMDKSDEYQLVQFILKFKTRVSRCGGRRVVGAYVLLLSLLLSSQVSIPDERRLLSRYHRHRDILLPAGASTCTYCSVHALRAQRRARSRMD